MNSQPPREESKRIRAFRLGLVKAIPKFPNDRTSLQTLERKPLGELLVDYANWAIRYVAPRPRKVIIELAALADSRWTLLQDDISAFLSKVDRGEDLTPHLSLNPHTRGYTPAASGTGPDIDRWADKDIVLNSMGFHHFHLSGTIKPKGFATRGNELLFAEVTRDQFTVIAIFDHSVFEERDLGESLTAERERLWQVFDERAMRRAPPNSVSAHIPIATSGHSLHSIYLAKGYEQLVAQIDPKVDDPDYISSLVAGCGFTLPLKQKWKWHFHYLDLCLHETTSASFAIFRKGPN